MDKGRELYRYQEGIPKTRIELVKMVALRIVNPMGYGFLNQSKSSVNLSAEISDMSSGWQTIKWQNDVSNIFNQINKDTEFLIISDVWKIDKKTYDVGLSLLRNHDLRFGESANFQIIMIANSFPETNFLCEGIKSYTLEENKNGLNLTEYELGYNKGKANWVINKPMLFRYQMPGTTEQIMMARNLAKDRSKMQSENTLWTIFQSNPDSYNKTFNQIFPETIERYLLQKKGQSGSAYVLDAFSDPSMLRFLKDCHYIDGGVAIGLLDDRLDKQKNQDKKANILYIAKAGTGGIYSYQTWKEAQEYVDNNIPQQKQGFDLIVLRPYKGWSIGEEPPYHAEDNMFPSFGIQIKIVTKLWELVGKNGSLLVQLYEDDTVHYPMLTKYRQILINLGFSKGDVQIGRGVMRINKTETYPKKLPI